MANKREIAKFNKELLNGFKNSKEMVEMALKVFDDFYSDCDTRGMAVIDRLASKQDNKVLVFEIEQWGEEKAQNTFDYSLIIVNNNKEVVYDEADGELPLPLVLTRFKDIKQKMGSL